MSKRCSWCGEDPLYVAYHDEEWGVPVYDDQELFEMINLEGAQAGLSWITVLRKRDTYRLAFDGFDPDKIIHYDQQKIDELLQDPGIIRNKLKVNAVITNAKLYITMRDNGESFSDYLWSFVDGKPIKNAPKDMSDVPATTERSDAMSKSLKKKGFKFVGSTICYAFMQAAGMVNDHFVDCPRYNKV
ncbi:MAG: DNA-3-methyladenine glycosylase I [Arenicella sp.]